MLNPKPPEGAGPQSAQPPKEMLTLEKTGNKLLVRINFSSLDLIQTCLRKAHYALNMNLKAKEESSALAFGTSIHKALEHWYQLPVEERVLPKSLDEEAELMGFGQGLEEPARHGALEAIRQFCLARPQVLSQLPEGDKRSLPAGVRILKAYFRHYAQDGFTVYKDNNGPVLERRAELALPGELTMADGTQVVIVYFGTIDVVLQHRDSGVICVADHKTTSALGQEFYQRCKPNHQYSGYVWLAQQSLGIDTKMFMINGIQTAKTKTEFARQITERTGDDFQELHMAVYQAVDRFLRAENFGYPMTAPNPCSMYGGCQYRKICELPEALKPQVIKLEYGS